MEKFEVILNHIERALLDENARLYEYWLEKLLKSAPADIVINIITRQYELFLPNFAQHHNPDWVPQLISELRQGQYKGKPLLSAYWAEPSLTFPGADAFLSGLDKLEAAAKLNVDDKELFINSIKWAIGAIRSARTAEYWAKKYPSNFEEYYKIFFDQAVPDDEKHGLYVKVQPGDDVKTFSKSIPLTIMDGIRTELRNFVT